MTCIKWPWSSSSHSCKSWVKNSCCHLAVGIKSLKWHFWCQFGILWCNRWTSFFGKNVACGVVWYLLNLREHIERGIRKSWVRVSQRSFKKLQQFLGTVEASWNFSERLSLMTSLYLFQCVHVNWAGIKLHHKQHSSQRSLSTYCTRGCQIGTRSVTSSFLYQLPNDNRSFWPRTYRNEMRNSKVIWYKSLHSLYMVATSIPLNVIGDPNVIGEH